MLPKNKRGQAAMEYLMTYGWALLVVVIVVAILFSLTSLFKLGDQCIFSQKFFSCSDPFPQVLTDGSLIFTIKNTGQKEVTITNVACTTEEYSGAFLPSFTRRNIMPGSSYTFRKDVGVKCMKSGSEVVALKEGDEFRGKLILKYKYADEPEGYEERQAQATLIATAVSPTASVGGIVRINESFQ